MSAMHEILIVAWFTFCLSGGVAWEGYLTRNTPANFLRYYIDQSSN